MRGQNLVLFALFLLLLSVAVMATMAVTQQTRRKLELNATSDAAAYSQAVATARTFNSIALLNRSQAATMVAMTGAQSAMSYVATYRGLLSAGVIGYHQIWAPICQGSWGYDHNFYGCGPANSTTNLDPVTLPSTFRCQNAYLSYLAKGGTSSDGNDYGIVGLQPWSTCKSNANVVNRCSDAEKIYKRSQLLIDELYIVRDKWATLDKKAGLQVLAIQAEGFKIGGLQRSSLAALQATKFDQVLTPSGAALSHQLASAEVAKMIAPGVPMISTLASSGSRRHEFITKREDGTRVLHERLKAVLQPEGAGGEVSLTPVKGSGYFAATLNHNGDPSETAVWGDEHTDLSISMGIGSAAVEVKGWVRSTDEQDQSDIHDYCPRLWFWNGTSDAHAVEEHTLAPHQMIPYDMCPNSSCIWPDFLDVDTAIITDKADAYGQPKAQISASLPADPRRPWNLAFRFGFTSTGANLDLRDGRTVGSISPLPQMVSTAMAYYHRPNHWKEPPNLFNPFWRATLVRADVDDAPLADVQAGLGGSAPWASEAVKKLMAAGYRGIP